MNLKEYSGVLITVVEAEDVLTSSPSLATEKIPFTRDENNNYNF